MKKQVTQWMAGGLAALLVLAGPISTAQARDKDWARAGKILTGLAIIGTIAALVEPAPAVVEQRTVYVEQPVYYTPPAGYPYYAPPAAPPAPAPSAYGPPPVPIAEVPVVQPYYAPTPVVVYETRYFQGRRMERCPRVSFRDTRYVPREIVLPYGAGMRLYQPGIRGHVATVQQWSPHNRSWVAVGSHPCIW